MDPDHGFRKKDLHKVIQSSQSLTALDLSQPKIPKNLNPKFRTLNPTSPNPREDCERLLSGEWTCVQHSKPIFSGLGDLG